MVYLPFVYLFWAYCLLIACDLYHCLYIVIFTRFICAIRRNALYIYENILKSSFYCQQILSLQCSNRHPRCPLCSRHTTRGSACQICVKVFTDRQALRSFFFLIDSIFPFLKMLGRIIRPNEIRLVFRFHNSWNVIAHFLIFGFCACLINRIPRAFLFLRYRPLVLYI